ncbi:MAG: V-type ATPase 116kDa subunit family protein [Candidatus Omnitrophota bacterium]
MKKVHLILEDKDIHQALEDLSGLGVLHLEHHQTPRGESLDLLREERGRIAEVIAALSQVSPLPGQEICPHEKQMFINVDTSLKEIGDLESEINDLQAQIKRWEPWGNFEPYDIRGLEKKGVHVKLFEIPEARLKELPEDLHAQTIFTSSGVAGVIIFSKGPIDLEWGEVPLPECGLKEMHGLLEKTRRQKQELANFVRECAKYFDVFRRRLERVDERIAYQEALAGRRMEDILTVVTGFCPVDAVKMLEQEASKKQWAYVIDNPSDDDKVPTLLRTPKWVRLIQPVFNLINVLPGYHEIDVSPVFLVFFSIFFGILIGDAGYGLVFAVLTGFVHWKLRRKEDSPKIIFYLMYLLSFMTVIWGLMTGTFLGQKLFPQIRPMVPWLADNDNVQVLCFFLGALHLSIAHFWRTILRFPSVSMLSQLGWASIVWGMFFLAKVLVLGQNFPPAARGLFIFGIASVLFFTKPSRNPLRAIGGGLAELALNVVNSFTDVVSYIRLFAVGLAGVAVADSFNVMVMGLGFDNFFIGLVSVLFLILIHAFNMILGVMAILVHGLRLNILEFSSHMGLEWAGMKYEPFKKNTAGG